MPEAMVGAVILAAGESSRLRQPKPLLPFHGATLLERTLTTVRAAGLEPIVVVLGHEANHVRRAVVLHGVEVVVNERHRDGMSTSVVAGLRAMPPRVGAALMVPVDQPFLAVSVLEAIVRRYKERASRSWCLSPEVGAARRSSLRPPCGRKRNPSGATSVSARCSRATRATSRRSPSRIHEP